MTKIPRFFFFTFQPILSAWNWVIYTLPYFSPSLSTVGLRNTNNAPAAYFSLIFFLIRYIIATMHYAINAVYWTNTWKFYGILIDCIHNVCEMIFTRLNINISKCYWIHLSESTGLAAGSAIQHFFQAESAAESNSHILSSAPVSINRSIPPVTALPALSGATSAQPTIINAARGRPPEVCSKPKHRSLSCTTIVVTAVTHRFVCVECVACRRVCVHGWPRVPEIRCNLRF